MTTHSQKIKEDPTTKATDSKTSVSVEIEEIYKSCPTYTYISAAIEWAERNDVSIEELPSHLADALKKKIEVEAISMRRLKCRNVASSITDLFDL